MDAGRSCATLPGVTARCWNACSRSSQPASSGPDAFGACRDETGERLYDEGAAAGVSVPGPLQRAPWGRVHVFAVCGAPSPRVWLRCGCGRQSAIIQTLVGVAPGNSSPKSIRFPHRLQRGPASSPFSFSFPTRQPARPTPCLPHRSPSSPASASARVHRPSAERPPPP